MDNLNPMQCRVCKENFDEEVRCPRLLNCSHHMCTQCIRRIMYDKEKTCPFCKVSFKANSVNDIMINHGLLECIKFMRSTGVDSGYASGRRISNEQRPRGPSLRGNFQPQKLSVEKAETLKESDRLLSRLDQLDIDTHNSMNKISQLQETVGEGRSYIKDRLLPVIEDVLSANEEMEKDLEETKQKLENGLDKLAEQSRQIEAIKQTISEKDSYIVLKKLLGEGEQVNRSAKKIIENLSQSLVDGETALRAKEQAVTTMQKVIKDFVDDIEDNQKEAENVDSLEALNMNVKSTLEQVNTWLTPDKCPEESSGTSSSYTDESEDTGRGKSPVVVRATLKPGISMPNISYRRTVFRKTSRPLSGEVPESLEPPRSLGKFNLPAL